MAKQDRADKQKEKEKKEKIILAALVGLLVIVGAFELPKMLKKSGTSAGTVAQTTSTSPGVTSGGIPASGPTAVSSLPNPGTYEPGAGQLSEFSLFNGRDPFGNVSTTSSATTTSPSTTTGTKTKSTTTSTTTSTTSHSYIAAEISVNGTSEGVLPQAAFPSASPAFVLDSVAAKQIKISVNGGSFASGQAKVIIKKGKSVVLVNTVDSIRYVIKYVAPLTSEQLAKLISATTTSPTTSATTPSSTTTGTTTTTAGTTT